MRKCDRVVMRFGKALGSFLFCVILFCPTAPMAKEIVVASTSLAGAIAKAAGAKEVRIITPGETRHPPEYEI